MVKGNEKGVKEIMFRNDFINMLRKLVEADVDQLVMFEVIKTFISDLEPDEEHCSVCDYQNREYHEYYD